LEHRASNPVSVKNLTAIETSTIVKLLRPYVTVGTRRRRRRRRRRRNTGKIRGCIQKSPDWPPGARTANGTSSLPLGAVVSLFCESV
jgi:hypothetical protein